MERSEASMDKRDVFGTEEALARISLELLEPDDRKLYTVTDVTPKEVFIIPLMKTISEIYGSKMVNEFIEKFLLLRISKLRAGRTEFVIITSGIREFAEIKKKGGKLGDIFPTLS